MNLSEIEVGKQYRVKASHTRRSTAGKRLAGKIITIFHIYPKYKYITTTIDCGGVWIDELEPIVVLTYETV